MRYWPDGTDFVITNGAEFFNRPLYSMNSGFRIDGGDRPEFSLYLPGRGGNLRLGIKTSAGVKWLNDARQIVTRYRPGSLLYAIRDPLLGGGELDLTVLPLAATKGFIVRAELHGAAAADLIWAYGGANGVRGSRDGDIGCERQPVSEFFQMQPEQCRSNVFSIATNTFTLRNNKTTHRRCDAARRKIVRGRRDEMEFAGNIAGFRRRDGRLACGRRPSCAAIRPAGLSARCSSCRAKAGRNCRSIVT